MNEDLKNIRLSAKARDIAERICESKLFEDMITVSKFALAYAVKYHFDEINPEQLDMIYDTNGSNYNIGTVDDDKFLFQLVTSLYPEITTPYRYVRVLMIFGLEKLGDLLDEGKLYPINQYM